MASGKRKGPKERRARTTGWNRQSPTANELNKQEADRFTGSSKKKELQMKKTLRWISILTLFTGANLFAYEVDWTDKNYPSGEVKEGQTTPPPNSRFKIDGQFFASYESLDHNRNGAPDPSGPNAKIPYGAGYEPAGFQFNRVYVNVRGDLTDGPFKGWSYRVTLDPARAASTGNAFTSNSANNEYTFWVKFAYVNIPIFSGASIRLGQQNTPIVGAQAGVSLEENWDHRYVDQTALEFLGIAQSADRGISFIYKSEYFGFHTFLANGEGFRKSNAQNLFSPTAATTNTAALDALSQGTGDSYGLTLYNLISFIPTGSNQTYRLSFNIPLRLDNIANIDSQNESRFALVDFTTATPTSRLYFGDARAKKDRSYGLEVDYTLKTEGGSKFGLGIGQVAKIDTRGNAYIIDNAALAGLNPADLNAIGQRIRIDEDAKGIGSYVYAHFRIGLIGGFLRLIEGTSADGTLNGQLGYASSRSWTEQLIGLPLYANGNPNVSLFQLLNPGSLNSCSATSGAACTVSQTGYDPGKSRLRSVSGGVTFHVSSQFRVTLGFSTLTGTDRNGQPIRGSGLDRVLGNTTGTASSTIAQQIATSAIAAAPFRSALGLASTDPVNPNYFAGRALNNKQVYIRSEFLF